MYYKGEKKIDFAVFIHIKIKQNLPIRELTRAEFDALDVKDENTLYDVKD
jgi:hypothetical protein